VDRTDDHTAHLRRLSAFSTDEVALHEYDAAETETMGRAMSELMELEMVGRRYVVEPGVVDGRSILALTNGHCHSFALALHEATGGELISFQRHAQPFDHVLCRLSDGRLADIGGARTTEEVLVEDGELRGVDTPTLIALPDLFDWVPANPTIVQAWVRPVLDLIAAKAAHQVVPTLTCQRIDDGLGLLIHFEWTEASGGVTINAFARRTAVRSGPWAHVLSMGVPEVLPGVRLIDFTSEALAGHADLAMQCFGPRIAQRVATPLTPAQPSAAG
jgi:hypothetical protein